MRSTPEPTRCCVRRSSTTAATRSPRPRPTSPPRGSPCASTDESEIEVSAGAADASARGASVIEGLARRPGGSELLELAQDREDVALVGGAVRDLLLGGTPREPDLSVASAASCQAVLAL